MVSSTIVGGEKFVKLRYYQAGQDIQGGFARGVRIACPATAHLHATFVIKKKPNTADRPGPRFDT